MESPPTSSALCLKLSSLDAFDFVWEDSSAGQKGKYSLHTKDILVSSISLLWSWFKIGVLQTKGCCCQPPQMQTELCWPILVNVTINWLVFENIWIFTLISRVTIIFKKLILLLVNFRFDTNAVCFAIPVYVKGAKLTYRMSNKVANRNLRAILLKKFHFVIWPDLCV